MIRPGLIRNINVRPEAIHLAYEGWALFVKASTRETSVGVGVLNVSYDTLMNDFFDRLLWSGGTVQDVKWLVAHNVMGPKDSSFYDAAFARAVVKRVRS